MIKTIILNDIFNEKVAKEVFGEEYITLPNGEVIKSWIHHLSKITLADNPQAYLDDYLERKDTIDKTDKTK